MTVTVSFTPGSLTGCASLADTLLNGRVKPVNFQPPTSNSQRVVVGGWELGVASGALSPDQRRDLHGLEVDQREVVVDDRALLLRADTEVITLCLQHQERGSEVGNHPHLLVLELALCQLACAFSGLDLQQTGPDAKAGVANLGGDRHFQLSQLD